MVKAIRGTLVKSEPSIKEVILKLGESEKFIIEDINDTAVFITKDASKDIKEKVHKIMSRNI